MHTQANSKKKKKLPGLCTPVWWQTTNSKYDLLCWAVLFSTNIAIAVNEEDLALEILPVCPL